MTNRASEEILATLHATLAEEMVNWIKNGDLSPAQASVITKFLKDNDITGVAAEGSPLAALANIIPELDFEDVRGHF